MSVGKTTPTAATFTRTTAAKINSIDTLYSQEVVDALNYRIVEEEKSARLYDAMSAWLCNNGYLGAGALWKDYAKEEWAHAEWSRGYLIGLGVQPKYQTIPEVKNTYTSLPAIIKESLAHEVEITQQCNDLSKTAMQKADFLLLELSSRYMKEQHEEVAKILDWEDQLKAFGTEGAALRLLDTEMGKKVL